MRSLMGQLIVNMLVLSALAACSSSEKTKIPWEDREHRDGQQVVGGEASEPMWVAGLYEPRSEFADYCENPRVGSEYEDRQGSSMYEKMWLRSMSHELYLWTDELDDIDPEPYLTADYFDLLKVPYPKDRFHWSQQTEVYQQGSESGVYFGYGINWTIIAGEHTLGIQSIDSGAELPDTVKRGDILLGVDDIRLDDVGDEAESAAIFSDEFWDALYPNIEGEQHVFILLDRDSGEEKQLVLTAGNVEVKSVPIVNQIETDSGMVAYVQFDRHNAVAEKELYDTFTELESANVSDLVLDLRYNGGGYIAIASELAYMIAGSEMTTGKTFVSLNYNDLVGDVDPFTREALEPIPFYQLNTEAQNLPTLNLDRVYVLTSEQTCSASELVMNGLAGVDVEVIQIGGTTCGKPYAYYPLDNCGTTYFTIMARNDNAKGFGDYFNGFSMDDVDYSEPDVFRGCKVDDDFSADLGAVNEAMLAAALEFRDQGSCPSPSALYTRSGFDRVASPNTRPVSAKLRTLMQQRSPVPFSILSKPQY